MRASTLLEIVAWTLGSVALTAYGGVRYWQHTAHAAGLEKFEAARSDGTGLGAPRAHSLPSTEPVDTSTWSRKRIAEYEEANGDEVTPEGVLRIPSLGLRVPIYQGTSERNLHRGAGRIEGTARLGEQGNIGIAAHRDGFFRVLEKVAIGDVVNIELVEEVQTYRVTDTLIVQPSDVSVLRSTGDSLVTLVTCYPFYYVGAAPKRFIVRAVRIDSPESLGATEGGLR
jgi:sortase A